MPDALKALLTRKMLICIFTGFTSGLPLYLLLNLLPAWLRSEGVNLKTIGFFALIQFPYTWKFLWSPLLDRYAIPWLGRRRGWTLLMQIGLLLCIGLLGRLSPGTTIVPVLWLAGLVALFSATQDIALDAYRRELLGESELGLGNAVHVNAYRIAGLVPGSLSLILADILPWSQVFWISAAFMLPGMVMILLVSEPLASQAAPRTLRQAVVEPFHEFIGRAGVRGALLVLAFIFLYKLGDSLCTALASDSTLRTRSIRARMVPCANMASKPARMAPTPTMRGPPGCTQTTSSSSAQQAISSSMSPFCSAS